MEEYFAHFVYFCHILYFALWLEILLVIYFRIYWNFPCGLIYSLCEYSMGIWKIRWMFPLRWTCISSLFRNICLLTCLFWLCWVLVLACRLSLVAVSGGCSLVALHRLLTWWLLLLQSTSPRRTPASAAVVNRLSYHMEPSQTRGRTCVSCIGRWILNH